MAHLKIGTNVKWRWGPIGPMVGSSRFLRRSTRTIRGTQITRNASLEEPAYLITQPRGGVVSRTAMKSLRSKERRLGFEEGLIRRNEAFLCR